MTVYNAVQKRRAATAQSAVEGGEEGMWVARVWVRGGGVGNTSERKKANGSGTTHTQAPSVCLRSRAKKIHT
jgi:hypothetical protein